MKFVKFLFKKINSLKIIILKKVRYLYFYIVVKKIGKEAKILGRVFLYVPENISIGNRTSFNDSVIINGFGGVEIGDDVHISPGVIINSGGLEYKNIEKERSHIIKTVKIHSGVWLASGVIINPGVEIGGNSVIGAGSVVTKNIPPNEVWVGVPARFLKNI